MAGEPAKLADVQAAVLKSAAGATAQQAPDAAAQHVAQDLSVMADQAKGYTAGVAQGLTNAQDTAANRDARIAQDRATQEAIYQAQIDTQRAQTAAASARAQAAAEAQRQQAEEAAQAAAADEVMRRVQRDNPPDFVKLATTIIPATVDYRDAQEAIDNYFKYFKPDTYGQKGGDMLGVNPLKMKAQLLMYAAKYHNAIQGITSAKQ